MQTFEQYRSPLVKSEMDANGRNTFNDRNNSSMDNVYGRRSPGEGLFYHLQIKLLARRLPFSLDPFLSPREQHPCYSVFNDKLVLHH